MKRSSSPLKIWLAGTSSRSLSVLETLLGDSRMQVKGVLTPSPRKIGRKQILTANPVANKAKILGLPIVEVDQRLDQNLKNHLLKYDQPDLLMVVDFGYIIPGWLLKWPKIAPLNIHPSHLPRWRGSTPGQLVLLYGEKTSSVSLMILNEGLDTGPIIARLPFEVAQNWRTDDYYNHAFSLINEQLVDLIEKFVKNPNQVEAQPEESPTPVAPRLSKEDGFIGWQTLVGLINGTLPQDEAPITQLSKILLETQADLKNIYQVIFNASKAFSPWPGLWTIVPTSKGEKRLKLLEISYQQNPQRLILQQIQLEGKKPCSPREILTLDLSCNKS